MLFFTCYSEGSTIKGKAFIDTNTDGVYDQNEKPASGAKLDLYILNDDSTSQLVDSVSIARDSEFSFTKLKKGKYYIQAILPKGFVSSSYLDGGNILLPSADKIFKTALINLGENQTFEDAFIAITKKQSYIRAFVFEDSNANGGRFSTEPVLKNIQLDLYAVINGTDYYLKSKSSDKKGIVEFKGLGPGKYRVGVEFPEDYIVGPLGKRVNAFYNTVVPNNSSKGMTDTFTLDAHSSIGLGIGCVKTSKVIGRIQNDNSSGIENAKITLTTSEGSLVKTLLSDKEGNFEFKQLQKGKYTLEVELPEDFAFNSSKDSSKITTQFSSKGKFEFDLQQGEILKVPQISCVKAPKIKLAFFNDTNGNGLLDENEEAFKGVKIDLIHEDNIVFTATSDENGIANLSPLKAGAYKLRLSIDSSFVFSQNTENSLKITNQHNVAEKEVTLNKDEEIQLNIGLSSPCQISGRIFEDENMNSILDGNEKNFPKGKVRLNDESNNIISETEVSENGEYTFELLPSGNYYLSFEVPYSYIFSNKISSGNQHENKIVSQNQEFGVTEIFNIKPAEKIENIDAAVFAASTIEGKITSKYNENGEYKDGDGNVENVKVELILEDGTLAFENAVSYTNKEGEFKIKGILPGNYRLRYTIEDSRVFTNTNDAKKQFTTDIFSLTNKEQKIADEVSIVKTFDITGFAFLDTNADGFFSDGDSFIEGTSITLTSNNGDKASEINTNANGKFVFTSITPGKYKLKVALPNEYIFNKDNANIFTPSLSEQEIDLEIKPNDEITPIVIAASKKASISALLYYDENLNGSYDEGEALYKDSSLTLKHEQTSKTLEIRTDENGRFTVNDALFGTYELSLVPDGKTYACSSNTDDKKTNALFTISNENNHIKLALMQFSTISGKVWNLDKSNNDIANIQIKLLKNNDIIAETKSNENGEYAFENLLPGKYSVSATLKDGYKFARSIDAEERNSVIISENDGNVKSKEITLLMGKLSSDNDIGIGAPGKLGDFVWFDKNKNGLQDGDEPGLSGLKISLYQFNKKIDETTTDNFGRYSFDNVYPGEYTLEVDIPSSLLPTIKNDDFPLLNSAITEHEANIARAKNIIVPSGQKNYNCDFGFITQNNNELPKNLINIPQKDWTPKVPYTPRRK